MIDAETPCAECGMPTRRDEFHPYIACLAFKACQSSKAVRENLDAIAEYHSAEEREACARVAETADASVLLVRTFGQFRDTLCGKIAAAIRGRQP